MFKHSAGKQYIPATATYLGVMSFWEMHNTSQLSVGKLCRMHAKVTKRKHRTHIWKNQTDVYYKQLVAGNS